MSLPSTNIYFHFSFLLSPIWHTPSRELQVLWRPQRLVELHLLSPSPIQLSHCGLEVAFSVYTDLIHVQVVRTATRLGTVRDMALFKRDKSYLDFFALARVFIHSIAYIQGGFTSSPSYIQSFMEVLLALHLAFNHSRRFTSSPSCI